MAGSLISFYGCQKELEEDFPNPATQAPEGGASAGMFTAIMERTRTFKNDYGEFYWHVKSNGMIGHSHIATEPYGGPYWGEWDAYNDVIANYTTASLSEYFAPQKDVREITSMKEELETLSEQDRINAEIYLSLSKLVYLYRMSKAVDLYNSVPFSEALQGVDLQFFPKYDDPAEIYKTILSDIKVNIDLASNQYSQMNDDGKATFTRQDIIFEGDISKWVQWAAAIRLRLAVRVSGVLDTEAKAAISEVLAEGNLPNEDLLIPNNLWISEPENHWKRGFVESDYSIHITPDFLFKMDRDRDHQYTIGIDDPRLPVICTPNRDQLYVPLSFDSQIGTAIYNKVNDENGYSFAWNRDLDNLGQFLTASAYSVYNPATFSHVKEPVRAFTLAEVHLLLAEVALKGLGTTPESSSLHIAEAVKASIDYWYMINSYTTHEDLTDPLHKQLFTPDKPSGGDIDNYATIIANEYNAAASEDDKMDILMWQKYLHLNIHDYYELFTELRRTRHPKLGLLRTSFGTMLNPVVERYPYPGSASAYNFEGYSSVADHDNFTSHIFWVPQDKRTESYYESNFNDDYMYIEYVGVPESFKTK